MSTTLLSQRLRTARLARGLSQRQLASLIGMTQSTISLVECGVTAAPGFTTILAVAQALDVTLAWLVSTDPNAPGGS